MDIKKIIRTVLKEELNASITLPPMMNNEDVYYEAGNRCTSSVINTRFGYSLNESEHPPVKGGDKLMRWGNGDIASLNDRLESGFAVGKFISTENAVRYSRTKWNRLDWDEQRKYAAQMNRQVTKYNIIFKDESFVSVPKLMYDQIRLPELPAKNYWQNYSA